MLLPLIFRQGISANKLDRFVYMNFDSKYLQPYLGKMMVFHSGTQQKWFAALVIYYAYHKFFKILILFFFLDRKKGVFQPPTLFVVSPDNTGDENKISDEPQPTVSVKPYLHTRRGSLLVLKLSLFPTD